MKSSDIVNEGIWDDMKAGYKAGKDDYIKRQYAKMQADKKAQKAAGKAAPAAAATPAPATPAPATPVKTPRTRKAAATTAAPVVTPPNKAAPTTTSAPIVTPPVTKKTGRVAKAAPVTKATKAAPVADAPLTFAQIQKSLDGLSKPELNKLLTAVIGKTNTRVSAGK